MEQLPLFSAPPFQKVLEDCYQEEINALGDISQVPIEFNIAGNDDYIDLKATTLHVTAKIVKSVGTAFPAETSAAKQEVAFINNVLHSMFADVIVSLNDNIV